MRPLVARCMHLPLAVLALGGLGLAAAAPAALSPEEHLAAQINWIRAKGGYYSSKIEYRNLVRGDPHSPLGMFLGANVDEGEVLMVVPKECVLTSGKDTCATVRRLARERQLGEKSAFHPYVRYVFDPRHDGDLPSEWSDEGIALLEAIAGEELFEDSFSRNVRGLTYEGECGVRDAPALEKTAYRHVLRRSWDDKMVPVYDMVNHRNPPYRNVDSNSPHTGEDVHVVALRDIRAGEQLYLSYNECTDCMYERDYAYTYVLPYILRDYGFVEQYPQRWKLFGGEVRFQIEEKVPDLVPGTETAEGRAFVGSGSPLKLTWLDEDGPPGEEYFQQDDNDFMHYLYGHLKARQDLPVDEMAKDLRPHEAYMARQFHAALVAALQHVIWYAEDVDDDVKVGGTAFRPVAYGVGDIAAPEWWTSDAEPEYNATMQLRTCSENYLSQVLMSSAGAPELGESERFELLDVFQSFYQKLTFWESREEDPEERDVFMKIEYNWESGQSNRPHYHETLVHYPASFIPEVKRVMFLGGGDSMILEEVVKYKSLELVVGMELDKGVVQASFLHFETMPHWDDGRVEWWFGDAAKSMRLLPEEYLGTFDIIYVDMQNFIVEELKIMEQVSRYAHPQHGIVMRNEDGGFGTLVPFALHNVDLYDGDVPVFCHQPITMGSNVTDFFTAPRYVHDVSNLYYEPSEALDESTRFSRWYNYRKADEFGGGGGPGSLVNPSAGIFMVLDLEEASAEKMSVDEMSSALASAGVSPLETKTLRGSKGTNEVTVFLAEEGYVLARSFPEKKYCAVDAMLGSGYDKVYDLERSLASALQSGVKSSYRIVTGASFAKSGQSGGKKDVAGTDDASSCKEEENAKAAAVDPEYALPVGQPHASAALRSMAAALIPQKSSQEIVILCGEESQPCHALDVARSATCFSGSTMTSLHACPAAESVFACESQFRAKIHEITARGNTIDAILVDAEAPKRSGLVLHRIFDRSEFRGNSLSSSAVVASATTSRASSAWLRTLLERFRKEFFPYDPSFHAEVLFHSPGLDDTNSKSGGNEGGLGVSIFSAGNPRFYADFMEAVQKVATTTGLSSDVRYVLDGMNSMVADFTPTKQFARGSYPNRFAAREQLKSQQPLGRQSVEQYTVGDAAKYSPDSIKTRLEAVLKLVGVKKGSYEMMVHKTAAGNGAIVVALWDGGDASVIYDGASQLDSALFTLDQNEGVHNTFEQHFQENMPSLTHALADVQLRGLGRVVAIEGRGKR